MSGQRRDHDVDGGPGRMDGREGSGTTGRSAARPSLAVGRREVVKAALGAGGAALAGRIGFPRHAAAQEATPAATAPPGLTPGVDYFPSPVEGVPDAYTKPPPPFPSVTGVPGRGGTVTVLLAANRPAPPPRDENRHWQELEQRLGVTWEPTLVPGTLFDARFATVLASGDLPDLATIGPAGSALQAIRQGAFADLTPYLTGDALQEYPNLAAIPASIWQSLAIEGKIYGVPRTRFRAGDVLLYRGDWAEKLGLPEPATADEFAAFAAALTEGDPDGNGRADTFALASGGRPFSLTFFRQMFRVPNQWRLNADGTLTNAIETEEYRRALAYVRGLFAAGVYHPDAVAMNQEQARAGFAAGQFAGFSGTLGGIVDRTTDVIAVNPAARVAGLVPPGHDGGAALVYNNPGFFGFAAISAAAGRDEERLRELLRLLDYWCAPFGSEEWLFLRNGIEGVHHTIGPDGAPVRTEQGDREIGDLNNVADGPWVFYNPRFPGMAQYQQRLAVALLAAGSDSPTQGLYVPAALELGAQLDQLVIDAEVAVVTGREPLDALDRFVAEWRSRGGDQVRREYEEALAAR